MKNEMVRILIRVWFHVEHWVGDGWSSLAICWRWLVCRVGRCCWLRPLVLDGRSGITLLFDQHAGIPMGRSGLKW